MCDACEVGYGAVLAQLDDSERLAPLAFQNPNHLNEAQLNFLPFSHADPLSTHAVDETRIMRKPLIHDAADGCPWNVPRFRANIAGVS